MPPAPPHWTPKAIKFQKRKLTSNSLAVIVETDAGGGYLKLWHDKNSPHDLVCEWVGTRLAQLVCLPTLEPALIDVPLTAPVELAGSVRFRPGKAFITRACEGEQWSGRRAELHDVVNPHDFGRLVAFDTWVMNCDRYRPNRPGIHSEWSAPRNVFLARDDESAKVRLTAIDHELCFKCQKDLSPKYLSSATSCDTLYGLFPEFGGLARREDALAAVGVIESITRAQIAAVVDEVPQAWLPDNAHRRALVDFVYNRIAVLRPIVEAAMPGADLTDDLHFGGATP